MTNRLVPHNPLWKKNIQAMQARNFDLSLRLSEHRMNCDNYLVSFSEDRFPFLAVKQSDGKYFPLDDLHFPHHQAQKWVQSLGLSFLRNAHVMLIGICSGYPIRSLFELSNENALIWMVEPSLDILKAVFHITDLSDIICSPRVQFVAGMPTKQVARMLFSGMTSNRMRACGIRMSYPPAAGHIYSDYIREMAVSIEQATQEEDIKIRSMEAQSVSITKNITANFSLLMNGSSILRLLGVASGFPAFLVGPGPSVQDSLSVLDENSDKGLIIAIDTACRILHRHHIQPDVIVSLDFTNFNTRHFEEIDCSKGFLAASPTIHPDIIRRYEGRIFFYTHQAARLLNFWDAIGMVGELKAHSSTAHAAYHLARLMGCSPIVLIGIDLSFSGSKRYAEGAIQNELQSPNSNSETLYDVPSNDGYSVQTSALYKMYLDAFTELIQDTAGVVINTSIQGAKIPGTSCMSLENLISNWNATKIEKPILSRFLISDFPKQRMALLSELKEQIDQTRKVHSQLEKLVTQLNSMNHEDENFSEEIRCIYSEFFQIHNSNQRIFSLCTSLCPRATIVLFGEVDDIVLYGGNCPSENHIAKNRTMKYMLEFMNAMKINLDSFHEIKKQLTTHFSENRITQQK